MRTDKEDPKLKRLVNLFFEAGTLRKIARSHRQTLLTDDLSDNIASHSFRATLISYFLAKQEKVDPYKVVIMALFHDFEEARSGDQNWVHKRYLTVDESAIIKDQVKDIVEDDELYQIAQEYEARKTVEAKLAKDADYLDQILLLKEYTQQGNKEADSWLVDNQQAKRLYSESAKKLAKEIINSEVDDWWLSLWTADRKKS